MCVHLLHIRNETVDNKECLVILMLTHHSCETCYVIRISIEVSVMKVFHYIMWRWNFISIFMYFTITLDENLECIWFQNNPAKLYSKLETCYLFDD